MEDSINKSEALMAILIEKAKHVQGWLSKNNISSWVVGGIACYLLGSIRTTQDIDILIREKTGANSIISYRKTHLTLYLWTNIKSTEILIQLP
jgi:hypothetical protein